MSESTRIDQVNAHEHSNEYENVNKNQQDNHIRRRPACKKLSITTTLTEIKQQQLYLNQNMNNIHEEQIKMNQNIDKLCEAQINVNRNQSRFFEQQTELIKQLKLINEKLNRII